MRKGEKTKINIIEKSMDMFNRKGYMTTSVQDVMEETGLKKGGIYRHFKSKDEIMVEAFHHAVNKMKVHYENQVSKSSSSQEKIMAFIDAFFELADNKPLKGGCPIINASIEMDYLENGALKVYIEQAMNGLILLVSNITSNGISSGEFKNTTDPKNVAVMIISSIEGALAISKSIDNKEVLSIVRQNLVQYIEGLTKESAEKMM